MGNLKTSIIISLVNRVTAPAKKVVGALDRIAASGGRISAIGKATKRVGDGMGKLTRETGRLLGKLTLLGGAGAWLFKSQLIDTASAFERFRTILETVEGSSAKAQKSMDWVSDFATSTPYELDQVMDAFVKLRAYGMDPTGGLLRSLGDTAAAMGKPLMQAVEAIADAVTGENERLKDFGIKAQVSGNKIRYAYTDRAGKQLYKIVDKNNRAMIQSTLEAIWNEKYAGAQDRQSKTFAGMMSNLSDQWTRFKLLVMENGAFDFLKGKLKGLLDTVNRMAAGGQLQQLAKLWGEKITYGLKRAWEVGTALWSGMKKLATIIDRVATALGGYENLLLVIAALMSAKVVIAVGSLAASLYSLGALALPVVITAVKAMSAAFLTNPIGLAVMAIAGAALLIYKYWSPISEFFNHLTEGIKQAFSSLWDSIGPIVDGLTNAVGKITDGLASASGTIYSKVMQSFGGEQPSATSQAAGHNQNAEGLTGELKISIDSEGRPSVKALTSSRNLAIDVDAGQMMRSH